MSDTVNENERAGSGDVSSLLTALLSDPQVLSRVGDTLAALSQNAKSAESTDDLNDTDNTEDRTKDGTDPGSIDQRSDKKASTAGGEALPDLPALLSKLADGTGAQSPELKREIDLLRAVRPYLSPRRQEMIDGFIRMSKLGEIFKSLSDGGKNVLQ